MAGERDVLAEALALLERGKTLQARALLRVTLSKSAPNRLLRTHNHKLDGHHWQDCTGCDDAAAPSPEPLPREALDVAGLRAIFRERGWSIFMEAAYDQPLDPFPVLAAALSPDRPTP